MEFFKNWGLVATIITVIWGAMYLLMGGIVLLIDSVGFGWGAIISGIVVSFLFTFFITFIQELETEEEKED